MEADNIFDPNYIYLGIKDARYRNQEWFIYNKMWIRAPRYAAQSATIILGSNYEKIGSHFDSASGWVILLPSGYFETVDLSKTPKPQNISDFYSFLIRLGVQESFTTFVALQDNWHVGAALVDRICGSRLLYCAYDVDYICHGGGRTLLNGALRHVKNNPVRFSLTTFVLPVQVNDLPDIMLPQGAVATVFNDFAHDRPGSAHFWRICSFLDSVVISGGSVYQYLSQQFMGPRFTPYGGFLNNLSGNPDITHISGCRFFLQNGSLKVTGFSLDQSRPARSWGSYAHKLVVENIKTAERNEYQLGSLKRDILDSLPFSSNGSTNMFGAFALPKNQATDISQLVEGKYRLYIEDSEGYNVINSAHTEILINKQDLLHYNLQQDGNFLILTVKGV